MSFPSSPSNGQLATVSGVQYQYNSTLGTWSRYVGNSPTFSASVLYENGVEVITKTASGAGNLTVTGNTISLTTMGPGATTVGSSTSIPVITTDAYGRVASLTSASVSSTLNTAGGTGTGSISLINQSLTIAAGTGISTAASNQTITVTNTGVTSAVAGTGIGVSGATGAVTITNNGIVTASAGTGISVSGTNPLTITNTGVTALTGTSNQVTASASTGSVTLSLPQNIHTGASPTFAGLTSSGAVQINSTLGVTGAATIPQLYINRSASATSGISWYASNYNSWTMYMSPASQTGCGPGNNITAPTGTLVTSWALRSFIENSAGYGWTWEAAANGTTTPTVKAEIRSSDGAFWNAGAIYCAGDVYSSYSDINLKDIVGRIENPIELIKQIDTFYYEPNAKALELGATPGRRVGVSAQSVKKTQPEATGISPLGKDYLTVQYERLVPLLVESIKAQQDQIDALTQELEKLKGSN